MKYRDNNLFDFIDYVLKSKNIEPKEYKPPVFLINRWLSMANPGFAKIINFTTNKWCLVNRDFDITNFYRQILPKYNKKISYIKKPNNQNESDDGENLNIASVIECSEREVLLFKQTLAELNISSK